MTTTSGPLARQPLDADAAAFLDQLTAAGLPSVQDGTPQQAREANLAAAERVAGPGEPVEQVSDGTADGVPVRILVPSGARGVTVYLHGGGWVVGTLDTYDTLCRELANRSGSTVISVGYDLSPEAPHPRALEQVAAVLRWVRREITGEEPLLLAGDSAGGYLAALAAGQAMADGLPVAGVAMLYPVVTRTAAGPASGSMADFATGHYLDADAMRWYWQAYDPDGAAPSAWDQDLSALPPVLVVTAGHDVLHDEGAELVRRLDAAGVAVEHHDFAGQIHGFIRLTALVGQSHEALDLVGAFLTRCAAART